MNLKERMDFIKYFYGLCVVVLIPASMFGGKQVERKRNGLEGIIASLTTKIPEKLGKHIHIFIFLTIGCILFK